MAIVPPCPWTAIYASNLVISWQPQIIGMSWCSLWYWVCVIAVRWNTFCRSWGRVSAFITLAYCRCSRKQLRFSSPKDSLRSAPYFTVHYADRTRRQRLCPLQ